MLKKLFGFDPTKTTVKTEIVAGITTFLTMSYILAVNPAMFSVVKHLEVLEIHSFTFCDSHFVFLHFNFLFLSHGGLALNHKSQNLRRMINC